MKSFARFFNTAGKVNFTNQAAICPHFRKITDFLFKELDAIYKTKISNSAISSFLYGIKGAESPRELLRQLNAGGIQTLAYFRENGSAVCQELHAKKSMPPSITYPALEEAIYKVEPSLKNTPPAAKQGPSI